jgi:hypothetical protein
MITVPPANDRAAGSGHRSRDRLVAFHPLAHPGPVTGDDEQRVVDPHPEPDHDRQRGADLRDLDEMTDQPDQAETDQEPEDRVPVRKAHRHHRPEREQEDDHRGGDPHRLAALGGGLRHLLAHVAADGHREPRVLRRGCGVDDAVRLALGELRWAEVDGARDVADSPILADRARALGREWADDPDHVGGLLQRVDRLVDDLRVGGVVEAARLGLHHHRVAPVRLIGELVLKQVLGGGRVAARDGEVVAGVRAGGPDRDHDPHQRQDPEDRDHVPAANHRVADPVEEARHGPMSRDVVEAAS